MSLDLPGFADPVLDAQRSFRAVLDAMARPGTVHRTEVALTPPPPLAVATAAVLLTLIDAETPLWAPSSFSPARDWIVFHCGAPFTDQPARASFIVCDTLPDLTAIATGSDEAPQLSATIILQTRAFGRGKRISLAGPGLPRPASFAADGLPGDFVAAWAANHALYPRGVDLILCAGDMVAALPRSVMISEG